MDFDIERAIKFPFEDKSWLKKVGVIFIIEMVLALFGTLFDVFNQLSSFLEPMFGSLGLSESDAIGGYLLVAFGAIFLGFLVTMLAIPFKLYFYGYYGQIMENVMDGVKQPLPEHNNLGYKFKLSLSLILIALGPVILFLIASGVLWIPVFVMFISGYDTNSALTFVGLFGGFFIGFIMVVGFVALAMVVIPAMTYVFFEKDSITDAYNFNYVLKVVTAGWKRFLLVSLIVMVLSWFGSFVSFFFSLCFLGFIVKPIVNIWTQLINAYLMGSVYNSLDDEIVLK